MSVLESCWQEKALSRASQFLVMQAEADVAPKVVGDYGFDPLNMGRSCQATSVWSSVRGVASPSRTR